MTTPNARVVELDRELDTLLAVRSWPGDEGTRRAIQMFTELRNIGMTMQKDPSYTGADRLAVLRVARKCATLIGLDVEEEE